MYFLWKRTPHGSIRVSQEGLVDFLKRILTPKSQLRGLTMAEGDEAPVTLVLSSDDATREEDVEGRLSSFCSPLGLRVRVIWVDRGAPDTEWRETKSTLYKSPWTWMGVAAMTALVVNAGMKGLFWTLFWGAAGWFTARFVPALFRRKKLSGLQAERR